MTLRALRYEVLCCLGLSLALACGGSKGKAGEASKGGAEKAAADGKAGGDDGKASADGKADVDAGKAGADARKAGADAADADAGKAAADAGDAGADAGKAAADADAGADGDAADGTSDAGADAGKADAGADAAAADAGADGKADAGDADTGDAEVVDVKALVKEIKNKKTTDERATAALAEAEAGGATPKELSRAAYARGEKLRTTPDRAQPFFEYARDKDPKYASPVWELAKISVNQGELDAAKEALKEVKKRKGKKLLQQIDFDPMWEVLKDDPDVRTLVEG